MQSNLIVDLSNVTFVTHHSLLKKTKGEFNKNYLLFKTIMFIKTTALKYKVDGILVACDSPNVWRKDLYPQYKSNRGDVRDPYYEDVKEVIIELKDFFNENTSIPAVGVESCEADDIIAVACQTSNTRKVIMSSDKDFVQLIDDNTVLYSPSQKKERTTEDKDFELFEKIIRGDRGDNIPSAYPRVYKKALEKAWANKKEGNDFDMINLMEAKNKKTNKKVKDHYELNKKLIDLTQQPDYIRERIEDSLKNLKINKTNSIKLMSYIGKHDMKNVRNEFLMRKDVFAKYFVYK